MPLNERNIETMIHLLGAHQNRYGEIQEIGGLLLRGHAYRSRDGKLEAGALSEQDKADLTKKIDDLLREAQVIANNILQELAPAP